MLTKNYYDTQVIFFYLYDINLSRIIKSIVKESLITKNLLGFSGGRLMITYKGLLHSILH